MNADQETARVVRKTLWIRQEHFTNTLDQADGAVLGIRIGE